MPPIEQILIGALVALLAAHGLWKARWLLEQTRKGQRLTHWLGFERALITLRVILLLGALFGILLATNVIRPIRW